MCPESSSVRVLGLLGAYTPIFPLCIHPGGAPPGCAHRASSLLSTDLHGQDWAETSKALTQAPAPQQLHTSTHRTPFLALEDGDCLQYSPWRPLCFWSRDRTEGWGTWASRVLPIWGFFGVSP